MVTVLADGVIADSRGGHVTHQFLILELVERETISALVVVVVLLEIGYHTWSHHQLHITGRGDLPVVFVLRFKVLTHHRTMGDDIGTQIEVDQRNQSRREKIGTHESLEAHASRQHGDDFGVAGQLRGEEDDGDKHEQRREQVGEVGHEVGVIVEDNSLQRSAISSELRQVLVDVEDDGDGDDEDDGVDVGADELGDDIPVEARQESPRIDVARPTGILPEETSHLTEPYSDIFTLLHLSTSSELFYD